MYTSPYWNTLVGSRDDSQVLIKNNNDRQQGWGMNPQKCIMKATGKNESITMANSKWYKKIYLI